MEKRLISIDSDPIDQLKLIVSKVVTFIEYVIKEIALLSSWNYITKAGGNQAFVFTKKHICVLKKALWTGSRASIGKQTKMTTTSQT